MIGHTLSHNEELYSLILEGMIEGKFRRNKPKTFYISQVIKDARVDSYKQLKAQDREPWGENIYCRAIYGLNIKNKNKYCDIT